MRISSSRRRRSDLSGGEELHVIRPVPVLEPRHPNYRSARPSEPRKQRLVVSRCVIAPLDREHLGFSRVILIENPRESGWRELKISLSSVEHCLEDICDLRWRSFREFGRRQQSEPPTGDPPLKALLSKKALHEVGAMFLCEFLNQVHG